MVSVRVFICVLLAIPAYAQISSTFGTDADGWTFLDGTAPVTVDHNIVGGNPGGYISVTYNASTATATEHWHSPAKFHGNHLALSLGMNFRFDAQQSQAGTTSSTFGDVRIESGGNVIIFTLPTKPAVAPAWTSYSIPLDETADWRWGSSTGSVATREQIKIILRNVTSIKIRGTFATNATYTAAIDNVILEQRALPTAPVITSLSTASAKPGQILTINGSGFAPDITNNTVYFSGLKATLQSASATQLQVVIPQGAVYGPITVTNNAAGLSAQSSIPFNPVFDGGGRIIPASYATRFTMNTIPIEGWWVADFDGDGWDDFAVTNNNVEDVINIYRNLGTGGELSAASFAAPVSIPAPQLGGSGTNGAGLWFVDLDGDGKLDAVTSNSLSAIAAAFLTLRNISTPGNIAFEAPEYWAGGSDETPIALIADFDGDGRPDLLAGEGSSGSTASSYFWINQNISVPGDIEFGPPLYPFNGTVVNAFAGATAGDLDGDGKVDLVISHNFGDRFTVLKNTSSPGLPSFENSFTIVTGQYNRSIQVMDINRDGKNDIAWKQTGGGIYVRINTNSGGPLVAADFATEFILTSELGANGGISLADVNGDGKVDLVCTDNVDIGVYESVFTGGNFTIDAFIPAYKVPASGSNAGGPRITDLNRDGKPDFIIASGSAITILENKNVVAPVISVTTVSPLAATVGATVTITGANFSSVPTENIVFFGAVQATVLTASPNELTVRVPAGATYAPVSVRKGELMSRYHLPFRTTFSAGVNFNNTHFAPPVSFTFSNANYDIEVGDLDLDGKPDIVAEGGALISTIFQNVHTTGAISGTSLSIAGVTNNSAANAKLVDVDGDGRFEIVGISGRTYPNQSTPGTIAFGTEINTATSSNVDFADFNLDGKNDIVHAGGQLILQENRSNAGVFSNSGTYGTLSANITLTKPATGGGVVTADFDNDGYPDVATPNPGTDNMSIYHNAKGYRVNTSIFNPRIDIPVGDNPSRIYSGDFDNDGKIDLLVYHGTGANPGLLIVFHNLSTPGNISFNRIDLSNPNTTTVATIADLDGDGRPEIITVSETGNSFSIFKNIHTTGPLSTTSFGTPFNTAVTSPRGLAIGDLNLDGKPEIILTRAAGFLLVYENLIPEAAITITSQPGGTTNRCEGDNYPFSTDATGTTNITFQWQKFNTISSQFEDLLNGGAYADVTTKNLQINNMQLSESGDYRCKIQGDFAVTVYSDIATLAVNALPPTPVTIGGSVCGSGQVELSATNASDGFYRWYNDAVGGEPIPDEENGTYTTPPLSTTTTYYVSIVNSFCETNRVPVAANVVNINKPVINSSVNPNPSTGIVTICEGQPLSLSAPSGFNLYNWSNGATSPTINISLSGLYTVTVTDVNGCASVASDGLEVVIVPQPCNNQPPVISTSVSAISIEGTAIIDLEPLLNDPDDNLDISTLRLLSNQTQQGATATINSFNQLVLDYGNVLFTGTDYITIEVCDSFGECTQQQLAIEVAGDIVVRDAFSPNGDGKNEFFFLQYITLFPDTQNNRVTIFNRWGDVVFETTNYDNNSRVFTGLNKNGNELPSGTYFYKIEFSSGRKTKTGYLSLKR